MILDTSILIEILSNDVSVQEKLEKVGERVSTTVITKYELLKARNETPALELLESMEIHGFDSRVAERCAKIFKGLKAKGKMINELDILIAAIAIAQDTLLVTKDKDFKNVDGLKLLVL